MAGYKSMFTCSATFNAGRSWRDIKNSELSKVYIDFQPHFERIAKPNIDKDNKAVLTYYDDNMPPRIAVWRPLLGCTALPIGASLDSAKHLTGLDLKKPVADQSTLAWPDGDLIENEGPSNNVDVERLKQTVSSAFDLKTYGEGAPTSAIVIVHRGRIIAEQYRQDFDLHTPQRTWSVAKSIAASVIGVAIQKGILELQASSLIPEWRSKADPRSAITLENLLHMSSGLWSTGSRTDDVYFGAGLANQHASTTPLESRPGGRWKYANNDTLLAIYSYRVALNDDQQYLAFPFKELLFKIGMQHTWLETDWDGNFIMSSQVWTTARDLARLGLLYLNNGRWNGEQILPEWWAGYVRQAASAQPAKENNGPQRAYGAQFWLYRDFPGLPEDSHAMLGNRGQIVMLIPSQELVIVRRGFDQSGPGGVRFDEAAFSADIVSTLL